MFGINASSWFTLYFANMLDYEKQCGRIISLKGKKNPPLKGQMKHSRMFVRRSLMRLSRVPETTLEGRQYLTLFSYGGLQPLASGVNSGTKRFYIIMGGVYNTAIGSITTPLKLSRAITAMKQTSERTIKAEILHIRQKAPIIPWRSKKFNHRPTADRPLTN